MLFRATTAHIYQIKVNLHCIIINKNTYQLILDYNESKTERVYKTMNLVQNLPAGGLDIVGDIHGEYEALQNLLRHLGYDSHEHAPTGRTLVFVGDFCDRGPNSPAVLALVQKLVKAGRAVAVLGNHEINLLRNSAKDGSAWFFKERAETDAVKYAPYQRATEAERQRILEFLSQLPIALERADMRVVHAAWQSEQIERIRPLGLGSIPSHYAAWENEAHLAALEADLKRQMQEEQQQCAYQLENIENPPPFLPAYAKYESKRRMFNPLKILTSGVEQKGKAPFYVSGKWRFVERLPWWDDYHDSIPVVVGHYWRRIPVAQPSVMGRPGVNLFKEIPAYAWHGKRNNVFCIDFSVGGRWLERKADVALGTHFKLAALRWPEGILQFDDGRVVMTQGFGG